MSKKKIPKTKQPWMVKDGCIFTLNTEELALENSRKRIQVHGTIAFNVGDEVANHIVKLHNASLPVDPE